MRTGRWKSGSNFPPRRFSKAIARGFSPTQEGLRPTGAARMARAPSAPHASGGYLAACAEHIITPPSSLWANPNNC